VALAVRQDDPISFRQPITVPERPLTWDDLQELPDDGRRFELVDGVLLVSPAPVTVHQRVVTRLLVLIHPMLPPASEVLPAPVDWHISEHTVFEPDIVVVGRLDGSERYLEETPLLAVEVLSPSTKLRDLGLKRRYYGDAGLPWYWIVDPKEPRLTVLRLVDGRFVEEAVVTGDEPYVATEPVAVTVVPSALVS
jgi:Uma2 family endonuclease